MVTLLYKRQNIIEEVIADLFGVSQGTVSEIITEFTPLIAQATEEFRPDAEEAKQMTRGRLALVDGTLWPCWSWEHAPEMWAGKYKTTGHGSLIIGDEFGNIIFVSDPAPGCDHDMKKREGEVKEILDLAGSVIADKGFQGSGYVTPTKKPQDRELYTREHEYNNQVSSIRAPIERAVAHLKTWKILFQGVSLVIGAHDFRHRQRQTGQITPKIPCQLPPKVTPVLRERRPRRDLTRTRYL